MVSIVSFQEQIRGSLAWLQRGRKPEDIIRGYRHVQSLLSYYSSALVQPFDDAAMSHVREWQRARIRIGTLDLRIAAIATVHDLKLLSRNLRDFRKVPGLDVEDWTA